MKKPETLTLSILLVCLFSCSFKDKKSPDLSNTIQINLSHLEEKNPLMDSNGSPLKHRLLKLETKNECLIKWIEKIIIDEKYLFVKDSNDKLLVFDINTGHFLNSIGKIGSGPNELLSFIDFYVDRKKKSVFIYDNSKSEMFEFTYQGKLLQNQKIKTHIFTDYFSTFTYTQNDELILTLFNNKFTNYNFRVIDTDKFSSKKDYLQFMVTGLSNLSFENQKITTNSKHCYAVSYLSDTIYQYSAKNGFSPIYIFNSNLQHINSNSIKATASFEIAIEAETVLKQKGISTGISQLFATDNLLYFPYYIGTDEYKIYWDIQNQKGFYTKNYFNSVPIKSMDNPIATTNDAFIYVIHPEDIIDYHKMYKHTDLTTQQILNKTRDDDNPILAFYYTK